MGPVHIGLLAHTLTIYSHCFPSLGANFVVMFQHIGTHYYANRSKKRKCQKKREKDISSPLRSEQLSECSNQRGRTVINLRATIWWPNPESTSPPLTQTHTPLPATMSSCFNNAVFLQVTRILWSLLKTQRLTPERG